VKATLSLLVCGFLLIVLPGCWDAKEIQDNNYVSAIGVDYVNKTYIAYIQILDFSNVAKGEGAKPTDQASVWVGQASGKTLNDAVNEIYKTSQQRVFWGHLTALVFSENVLRYGTIEDIIDLTNRYREIRYTKWLFATRSNMKQILSITPFFKLTPLASVLHEPMEAYRQKSTIKPIRFLKFTSVFHEPGATVLLPSITVNRSTWTENEKPTTMLQLDGVFLIHGKRYLGWISEHGQFGARWFNRGAVRNPLTIMSGTDPVATLIAGKPKPKIKFSVKSDEIRFRIGVKLNVTVNELLTPLNIAEIKRGATEVISNEIKQTYLEGIKMKADILNLGEAVYKKNPSLWRKKWGDGRFPLNERSIEDIDVQIKYENAGKYKLEK